MSFSTRRRGRARKQGRAFVVVVLGFACAAYGCLPMVAEGQDHGQSHPVPGVPVVGQMCVVSQACPPAFPGEGKGVYLGAFVRPNYETALDNGAERKMAVLHYYSSWDLPAPISSLRLISKYGAVPLLDWACGDETTTNGQPQGDNGDLNIVSGLDNEMIFKYAQALAKYRKPVFLRWYWEMNLQDPTHEDNGCDGSGTSGTNCVLSGGRVNLTPAQCFQAAWAHIWLIFHGQIGPIHGHTVDASNVAFVWCPSVDVDDWAEYWPGLSFVDWICADGYSPSPVDPSFASLFGPIYNWALQTDPAAPFMVGETGSGGGPVHSSQGTVQETYLSGAVQAIVNGYQGQAAMSNVQALVYFDAVGKSNPNNPQQDWTLQPGLGFEEFCQIGTVFTFGEPPGKGGIRVPCFGIHNFPPPGKAH